MHATDSTILGSGTSEDGGMDMDNDMYGPWMIMTCRKAGQRGPINGVVMEDPIGSVQKMVTHDSKQGNNGKSFKLGWTKEPNTLPITVSELTSKRD